MLQIKSFDLLQFIASLNNIISVRIMCSSGYVESQPENSISSQPENHSETDKEIGVQPDSNPSI